MKVQILSKFLLYKFAEFFTKLSIVMVRIFFIDVSDFGFFYGRVILFSNHLENVEKSGNSKNYDSTWRPREPEEHVVYCLKAKRSYLAHFPLLRYYAPTINSDVRFSNCKIKNERFKISGPTAAVWRSLSCLYTPQNSVILDNVRYNSITTYEIDRAF